jgi:hypothetical protein
VPSTPGFGNLVGRGRLLERLSAVVDQVASGEPTLAFVAGEAGIGKTSLLDAAVAMAEIQGAQTARGICVDGDGAPGYWPWSQALDALVRGAGPDRVRLAAGDDTALLAAIVPSFATGRRAETSGRDRLLAMDAAVRLLATIAADRPVLVVLDDLQWADGSSLELLGFVAKSNARIGLLCAYRHDEPPPTVRRSLSGLVPYGEHLQLEGLDLDATQELIAEVSGAADRAAAEAIHRRTAGHPFFVRELALLELRGGGRPKRVPVAVRDAIDRRLALLPEPTLRLLETAALVGSSLQPDVVAAALETSVVDVEDAAVIAVEAGVLTRSTTGTSFAHDLLRETLLDRFEPARRIALHAAIGRALEARVTRGGHASSSELARHFVAAIPVAGADKATHWALAAAADECAALAFVEGADHLRRLRAAVTDAAVDVEDRRLVDVLVAEADARARAGTIIDARGLLRLAADIARRCGDPGRVARVALANAQLGARFAMRRDETIRELDAALAVVRGVDDVWEARLGATLARELQHSVPEDRPRAGPLVERALDLGRRSNDPATLLSCLLARHDLLWTPGAASDRAALANEIIVVSLAAGDADHHAQGLLLLANAQLELGSPAFETSLESCLAILEERRQPRHRYTVTTRRACIALLRGRLEDAEALIAAAASSGDRIREPDTGNVRMSQRLELVRARAEPDELREFAAEAVVHWVGAPSHAHAVAAGFLARAGDADAAAQHLATVVDLGSWRADRSYLWSVFVRELSHAAIALDDRELCRQLFDDLHPLADSCGVNGAVVAFAGSHAHTAGLLAAALGHAETARPLLDKAASAYRRLGAELWLAEVTAPANPGKPMASMRREGDVWRLVFGGQEATVPHTKGLADLARLLDAGGTELHVLQLIESADRSGGSGDLVDRTALHAYRRRLLELDEDIDDATLDNDPERRVRAETERRAVIDELGRVSRRHYQPRTFANHPTERARKAVAARIRDAIRKLGGVLPEMARHLEGTIVTGTYCRYRPDDTRWDIAHH